MDRRNKIERAFPSATIIVGTAPTHLFIGTADGVEQAVINVMQKSQCPSGGCTQCARCKTIAGKQDYEALWFYPEGRYTLEQFELLFEKITFGLDNGARFFVVIQRADALSSSCANSLLKLLEEPPAGYYFLLTAQRLDEIVPTIRSRCIVHTIQCESASVFHQELFHFFTSVRGYDPIAFVQQLQKSNLHELDVVDFVDALLLFWMREYKRVAVQLTSDKIPESVLTILKNAYKRLPMPGSSTLFLRDLYLQLKSVNS